MVPNVYHNGGQSRSVGHALIRTTLVRRKARCFPEFRQTHMRSTFFGTTLTVNSPYYIRWRTGCASVYITAQAML